MIVFIVVHVLINFMLAFCNIKVLIYIKSEFLSVKNRLAPTKTDFLIRRSRFFPSFKSVWGSFFIFEKIYCGSSITTYFYTTSHKKNWKYFLTTPGKTGSRKNRPIYLVLPYMTKTSLFYFTTVDVWTSLLYIYNSRHTQKLSFSLFIVALAQTTKTF